jgi:hypothetical protein
MVAFEALFSAEQYILSVFYKLIFDMTKSIIRELAKNTSNTSISHRKSYYPLAGC